MFFRFTYEEDEELIIVMWWCSSTPSTLIMLLVVIAFLYRSLEGCTVIYDAKVDDLWFLIYDGEFLLSSW